MLVAVVAGTLLGGVVVVTLPRLPASPAAIFPPWWLLAVAFAVAEVWRFPIQVRGHRTQVSLGAVPLVVGLFALTPAWLLVSRLVGAGLVLAVLRGRPPARVTFGLAVAGLQVALAGGTMWALAGGNGVLTVQGWCAALVAAGVVEVLEGIILHPAGRAQLRGRRRSRRRGGHAVHRRDLGAGEEPSGLDEFARSLATALVLALVGLLLTTVLALGPGVAVPAVPCLLAAALGYRLYLLLLEQSAGTQRLLGFTEHLREAGDVDDVARLVVDHVTELVGARRAELVIGRRGHWVGWAAGPGVAPGDGPGDGPGPGGGPGSAVGAASMVGFGACGPAPSSSMVPTAARAGAAVTDGLWAPEPRGFAGLFATAADGIPLASAPGLAAVVADGEAVLAAAGRFRVARTGDPAADRMLDSRGLHEAVVLPIGVGDGLTGALLVGERVQPVLRGHSEAEIEQLGAVANQAALALRHVLALERLRHEATHDQLTGLPDRQQFRRQTVQAVTEAVGVVPACAVGVLDLDGFKTVNDSLGHLAGDAVLAEVGRRMAALYRDGLQVSRLGGDEFAVLVRGVRDEAEAIAVARRLLETLHAPFEVMGDQVRLTGSLGLALAPRDGVTPEQLLRNADVAMYAAKEEAGGVRMYSPELTEMLDAPLSLAADLRLALARGDVTIAVQPLVDLATGRLHSVEALARWRHPVLGVVNPEAFVMAAERVGLVGELTNVVIEQALRACQSWLACGLEVQVAVNLAARTLSDPELPAQVEAALHRCGVPGRLLCLELTETGVISSPDRALAVLARLRELGVRLAVDDFGTGYSSMTYMNWLAPDQVKIDKSFVQRLRFDPRNEAIVRSIIDLANNLGVDVVAEGVGDAGTATRLADLGCTIGQGFLFAEPMPTGDLADWVARWMSVPEREELPETESDPITCDDVVVVLGSGATMGLPAMAAVGTGTGPISVRAGTGSIAGHTGPIGVRTGPIGVRTGPRSVPQATAGPLGPMSGSAAGGAGPLGSVAGPLGDSPGDDGGEVRLHVVR